MVTLNRAVALAMVHGPQAGLELLGTLDERRAHDAHHRLDAVRAHLLELAGDTAAARECYRRAGADDEERSGAAIPCTTCGRARKKSGVGVGSGQRRS